MLDLDDLRFEVDLEVGVGAGREVLVGEMGTCHTCHCLRSDDLFDSLRR